MTHCVVDLLKEKGLKRTKLRMELLNFFAASKHAQSHSAIKNALGGQVDKSSLYRNLAAFEEVGLIHRITDHSGIAKYAFGQLQPQGGNHAHFFCDACETVYCVEAEAAVAFKVPEGFDAKNIQTIIRGTCSRC